MRLLLSILLTLPLPALAQFGAGVAAGGWEPLNIVTKAGIVACYDAGNASTITLNGTGVQQLRSRVVGVTNHLNQATAGNQPRYDTTNTVNGRSVLYFDGLAYYIETEAFSLSQPFESWLLLKQHTWSASRRLFDGLTNNTMIYQRIASPGVQIYAGKNVTVNNALALETWGVLRSSFDSSNSISQINLTAPIVGDAGVNNAGGVMIGASVGASLPSNISFAYGILCSKTNGTPEANFLRTCLMRRAGL